MKTIFAANERHETYWDLTIDGVTVSVSELYMEEIVKRYLKAHKLHAADQDGKYVELKGLF